MQMNRRGNQQGQPSCRGKIPRDRHICRRRKKCENKKNSKIWRWPDVARAITVASLVAPEPLLPPGGHYSTCAVGSRHIRRASRHIRRGVNLSVFLSEPALTTPAKPQPHQLLLLLLLNHPHSTRVSQPRASSMSYCCLIVFRWNFCYKTRKK